LELGFPAKEAKRLQAASRKQVNDTRLLKEQLMAVLAEWIEEHHLKQAEAAEILMVSRPRVSDIVNKKTSKFTIDTSVEMLSRESRSGWQLVDIHTIKTYDSLPPFHRGGILSNFGTAGSMWSQA
jgi:predicted XRE-type DNA-binding protein